MKKILLIIYFLCIAWVGTAQWVSINPGAGGQVQDVVPDPNTPDHLILASDMEGIYESVDNGDSWHIKGSLPQNRVYSVAFSPKVGSTRLYIGTVYGLSVSDDGGETSALVEITKKKSIGAIAEDPNDENNILAGIGWRDDYDFANQFGMGTAGKGTVFRSTDGGNNWSEVIFNNTTTNDRNVFTILYDKNTEDLVYMGTGQGLFKSTDGGATWSAIASPSGAGTNQGVALSPDGEKLYAAYTNGYLYATLTSSISSGSWIKANSGIGALDFWYPEVDPRSTGDTHKVIVSLRRSRSGLHEATFNWTENTLNSHSWDIVWNGTDGYDTGWDIASPNPRFVHYTPTTWPNRALWSTTNQTIFEGVYDTEADNSYNGTGFVWNNKYSEPNYEIMAPGWGASMWPCYSSRGTESTYSYDIAVHENYVIQGEGDNGVMESWDGGVSWSNVWHRSTGQAIAGQNLSDAQAVTIGSTADGVPVAIAQMSPGYGGAIGSAVGTLFAKKLVNHSPTDEWVYLAGGASGKGGLPTSSIPSELRDIEVSPAKPDRVFMFVRDQGMYILDDLGASLDAGIAQDVTKIYNASGGATNVKKIAPHPTDPDMVFFNGANGQQGVYRGEKTGPGIGDWEWQKVYNGSGWDAEVTTWEYNGQVYLFYFGASSEPGNDGGNFIGALSTDNGDNWTKVVDQTDVKAINTPSWYDEVKGDYRFTSKGGIVGYDDKIIICYYDHRQQKTYGVYKGTITNSAVPTVAWTDWTDDQHFGGFTSGRIADDADGVRQFYVSTAGAGSWRRPVEEETLPPAPSAPTGFGATSVSYDHVNLVWTDNSDNESGFRIERKSGAGDFEVVATTNANAVSYADAGLVPLTAYTYRIYAVNKGGNSGYTAEKSATTLDPPPAPDAPTGLAAVAVSSDRINLSWSDNSDNETLFKIERKSGGEQFAEIASVGENVTTYANEGLNPQTEYTYRVLAYNVGGVSGYTSEESETTLEAEPCNSSTIVRNGEFDLAIPEDPENSPNPEWLLYNGTDAASTFKIVDDAGMSGTNAAFIKITSGGAGTNEIQFYSQFTTTLEKNVTYVLEFKAKASVGRNITARSFIGKPPWSGFLDQTVVLTTEMQDFRMEYVPNVSTPDARVDFFLGAGTGNVWIDAVSVREKCEDTPAQGAPKEPTTLEVTAKSSTQIDLLWTDNSDNEDGFVIERAQGEAAYQPIKTVGENVTTHQDMGLSLDTDYKYRVKAYNDAGDSYYSNVSLASTSNVIISVTGVSIDNCKNSLEVGESLTLTSTVSPMGAGDKSVKWTSSMPAIANVDELTGILMAMSEGVATITVATTDGAKTAECKVAVTADDVLSVGGGLDFAIYPNPLGQGSQLSITISNTPVAEIQVLSLSGELLYYNPAAKFVNETYQQDLSQISAKGIYLVRVQNDVQLWVHKLVVE
ncbi:fibronectin type III domain-containing protein [Reichenbachiella carrageenanivorans]|uniref:Fibronectin type III domain-containing protein n=1 Tax=Reichenbachiella carrageenanivorans TaxID=2979869 RepID=A0ABY6CZG7_9BACT|nr:fibronectin type III domain-containing protein [Reichenbachiella carrageenanivorans]UXX79307.1 fibronectin type III domain-containing protein [Reichenbachiella carrageenanivorans]